MSAFATDGRAGAFLNADRVNGYAKIAVVSMVAFLLVAHGQNWRAGSDFLAFWTAGQHVWGGTAPLAYDLAEATRLQKALGFPKASPFLSPPPFLLGVAPLAKAPYVVGLTLWLLLTYAAFAAALRSVAPRGLLWPALAFPSVLVCGMAGQTGLLTAALAIGALGLLRTRPAMAGLLIGCMVIKPHLAILFPFALLAAREWRAFWAASATLGLLLGVSVLLFGPETFAAYVKQSALMGGLLLAPDSPIAGKLQSVLGLAMALGAPMTLAWTVQALASLAVALLTAWVWRRTDDPLKRAAVLCAATPLVTPYVFAYDLPLLVVPVVWLAAEAMRHGFRPGERIGLVMVAFLPMAAYAVPGSAPAICALLLAAVLTRAGRPA